MGDRGGAAGRGFDERAQPAGRDDAAGVDDPDAERDREDRDGERDDEAGRADAVTGRSRQEAEQRERSADRSEREPEKEVSREACGSTSRLVGARPRDGSAPGASGGAAAGNLQ
jgi:hypothetical protein